MKNHLLQNELVKLIPATLRNRKSIFNWMVHSDITPFMFGPPTFPELEAPDWEEFLEDYTTNYFTDELPLKGRCFIIKNGRKHVGQINYNPIDTTQQLVELDIWLAQRSYTGKGYGTAAIQLLCNYLQHQFNCNLFFIQPSARNPKAVKAYQKIGFQKICKLPKGREGDYYDSVYMIKEIK